MSGDQGYGTLESIDGRPALRFERLIAYPIERVWQAVSVPSELRKFFPGAADWTPISGESIDLGERFWRSSKSMPPTC
ncbi:hypothetical protein [Streptomyces oceani]|uniref:hypothetical protein n=1 Tax=Streptomyces oceani TaxID=1075402 RepID=UPI000AF3E683|nr:hypothetical protein [Streptomyces oceani]